MAASPSDGSSILIAGGGSGGHISPGLAIAERLREIEPGVKIVFACSNRAIDATMLRQAGARFVALDAAPLSLRPRGLLRFIASFRKARRQADDLLRAHDVRQVVTMGGFVAAPVVAAARRRRVPVTLINLDNPPGKANRWIAKRCDRVISSVPVEGDVRFSQCVVGVPLRRAALAPQPGAADSARCRHELGLDPSLETLLVTGASQGARSINQFMIEFAASDPATFAGWQIHHLAGEGDDRSVREAYQRAGIRALVQPFTHRMGLAWGAAELAVTRAGANSVAEVAANAVPALFLPYPFHRDRHQFHNAQPLADLGGAVILEDCVDSRANLASIGPVLRTLMQDQDRRQAMREALRRHRPIDAAARIAELVLAGAPGGAPGP